MSETTTRRPPQLVSPDRRPVHPNTGFNAERVVRTVLEGLREPDVPGEGDGVRTAYHLCAPAYREEVGGLDGLHDLLETPLYRPLVGHDGVERGALEVDDAVTCATQDVLVVEAGESDDDETPEERTYEFTVEKQSGGKYDGCWLVTDVVLVAARRQPGFQHTPTVSFAGREIKCTRGTPLRDVLLQDAGLSPHNDATAYANCNGNGVCGTCAVQILDMAVGENVGEPTTQERRRTRLPPLHGSDVPNLRLSCQTRVLDDVEVVKHDGLWGQHLEGLDADVPDDDGDDGTDDGHEVAVDPAEYEPGG